VQTDVDRFTPGSLRRDLLQLPFLGCLAAQGTVTMVVVEVPPLLGFVDDDALEHPAGLVGVDPVGPLDLAVQPQDGGLDLDVVPSRRGNMA
jgi:hypothetical protein